MKTVLRNGSYERVSDDQAELLVKRNLATYAPKSEWKRTVRDAHRIEKEVRAQQIKESRKEKANKKHENE
jgi:hypothetical protein